MESVAFYLFGAFTIAFFIIVVSTNNLLYALSALAAGMVTLSSFYFLLGAEFLGVAQIIVYTGAVIVVYAFSLMFFDANKTLRERINNSTILLTLTAVLFILLLATLLIAPIVVWELDSSYTQSLLIAAQNLVGGESPLIQGVSDTQMIGYRLFAQYLIPFEVAAIMLLVAMIAGIVLASNKTSDKGVR